MSYLNPTINTNDSTPIGLDAAISSVRTAVAGVSWISKSFGRAWTFREVNPVTERVRRVPKVYEDSGEYVNALPNDSIFTDGVAGSSFITVPEGETYTNFAKFTGSNKRAVLNLIVWADLKLIDPTKDYIFIEQLKNDIENVLSPNQYVSEIISWVDERIEDVFEGFDFTEEDQASMKYLAYPYAGFRCQFAVEYVVPCP